MEAEQIIDTAVFYTQNWLDWNANKPSSGNILHL